MKELIEIQKELKAPKSQTNSFGKYKYRSLEDILEALKPIMYAKKCYLIINDSVEMVGDRFYIKATATLFNDEGQSVSVTALAREENDKKGMDSAQLTGATSSYARKYALNGLFAIDDTKDADATNTHGNEPQPARKINPAEVAQLSDLIEKSNTDIEKFCNNYKINTLGEMYLPHFQDAVKLLNAKIKKANQ